MAQRSARGAVLARLGVAPILGIAAIVIGAAGGRQYDAPLFPAIRSGIEGLSLFSLFLLIVAGFAVTCGSELSPMLVGLLTMAGLRVLALLEMIVDPSSHNLWPFEFGIYLILALAPMIGGYVGQVCARVWRGSA